MPQATITGLTDYGLSFELAGSNPNYTIKGKIDSSNLQPSTNAPDSLLGFEGGVPKTFANATKQDYLITNVAEVIIAGYPIDENENIADAQYSGKEHVIGLATNGAGIGGSVTVRLYGLVSNIDTSALTVGFPVFLGTGLTLLTSTIPTNGPVIEIGICTVSHATTGAIFVAPKRWHFDVNNDITIASNTGGINLLMGGGSGNTKVSFKDVTDVEVGYMTDQGVLNAAGSYGTDVANSDTRAAYLKSDGTLGYSSSSQRYKKNIREYIDASLLKKVIVHIADRKDGSIVDEVTLIAEELINIFPNIVTLDKHGRPESINYEKLIPHIIRFVQQLDSRLRALE